MSATSTYRRSSAQANADFDRAAAQDSYAAALAQLDNQARTGRRQIDSSMLGRGVYRSGETNRRRADLEAGLLGAREAADAGLANQYGQIDLTLQNALLGADASDIGGGGGGGGGDTTNPYTAPAFTQPMLPPLAAPVAPVSYGGAVAAGTSVVQAALAALAGRRPRSSTAPQRSYRS